MTEAGTARSVGTGEDVDCAVVVIERPAGEEYNVRPAPPEADGDGTNGCLLIRV